MTTKKKIKSSKKTAVQTAKKRQAVVAKKVPKVPKNRVAPIKPALPAAEKVPVNKVFRSKKWLFVGAGALLIACAIVFVPTMRKQTLGVIAKKDVSFVIKEVTTGQAVGGAIVILDQQEYVTDDTGYVIARSVPAGTHAVTVSRPFYDTYTTSIAVPVIGSAKQQSILVKAQGLVTQVKPLQGIRVEALGSYAATNKAGMATLVLPFGTTKTQAVATGESVLTTATTIQPVQDSITNTIYAIPSGYVVYPTSSSGQYEVVLSNLNGEQKKVLATGALPQDASKMRVFMSPDTQYAAFYMPAVPYDKLFIVHTKTAQVTAIPLQEGTPTLLGWLQNELLFTSQKINIPVYTPEQTALYTYNTENKELKLLDKTLAEGTSETDYAAEYFGNFYINDTTLYYEKYWKASYYYGARLANKKIVIHAYTRTNGTVLIAAWQAGYDSFVKSVQVGPKKYFVYVQQDGVKNSFWELQNQAVVESAVISAADFTNRTFPTYYVSPSGTLAVWQQQSKGKNDIFIGDEKGTSQTDFALQTDYSLYGWYSNDYVLVHKAGSLYVVSRFGIKPTSTPLKISDNVLY
jgi:hypothetical protein